MLKVYTKEELNSFSEFIVNNIPSGKSKLPMYLNYLNRGVPSEKILDPSFIIETVVFISINYLDGRDCSEMFKGLKHIDQLAWIDMLEVSCPKIIS